MSGSDGGPDGFTYFSEPLFKMFPNYFSVRLEYSMIALEKMLLMLTKGKCRTNLFY